MCRLPTSIATPESAIIPKLFLQNDRAYALYYATTRYTLKGLPDGKYTLEAKRYALRTGPG
jgi:hypothetical protein